MANRLSPSADASDSMWPASLRRARLFVRRPPATSTPMKNVVMPRAAARARRFPAWLPRACSAKLDHPVSARPESLSTAQFDLPRSVLAPFRPKPFGSLAGDPRDHRQGRGDVGPPPAGEGVGR